MANSMSLTLNTCHVPFFLPSCVWRWLLCQTGVLQCIACPHKSCLVPQFESPCSTVLHISAWAWSVCILQLFLFVCVWMWVLSLQASWAQPAWPATSHLYKHATRTLPLLKVRQCSLSPHVFQQLPLRTTSRGRPWSNFVLVSLYLHFIGTLVMYFSAFLFRATWRGRPWLYSVTVLVLYIHTLLVLQLYTLSAFQFL